MMGPCEDFGLRTIHPLWATTPLLAVYMVKINGPTHKYRQNAVWSHAIILSNSGAAS
jgi:hypothetical protein